MLLCMMNKKLLKILYKRSFRYDPDFGFTLASGKKSDVYVDVKKTVLSSEGMALVGEALYEKIKGLDIRGIGGLTLGADPLAYAAAMVSNRNNKPLDVFIVRKEVKGHGTKRKIEGSLEAGDRVCVVDDVITTGGSTIKAIEGARAAGLEVVSVLALVDRQEGGSENILEASGITLEAVCTKSELLALVGSDKG